MSTAPDIKSLSLIKRLAFCQQSPLDWIESIAKQGNIVDCQLGPLVISNHHWIEAILIKHYKNFVKSKTHYELMRSMLGDGLLTSDAGHWQQCRQAHQAQFSHQHLNSAMANINQFNQSKLLNLTVNSTLAINEIIKNHVTELFFILLVGNVPRHDPNLIAELIQICNEETSRLNPFLQPIKKRKRCRKTLAKLHTILLEAAEDASPDGLLYPMIHAYKTQQCSHQYYLAEMKNFFVAGAETTASSLNWLFALLLKNPETHQQLVSELHNHKTSDHYLQSCIYETLRLYPPIWCMLRRARKSIQIQRYTISPNRSIVMSPYCLHRSPDYWEQPLQFKPERFDREQVASRPKNCFIPFGLGPRVCIGKHLAILVMKLVVETLLKNYQVVDMNTSISMHANAYVTLQRKDSLWVQLQATHQK